MGECVTLARAYCVRLYPMSSSRRAPPGNAPVTSELQQLLELIDGEPRVSHQAAHRYRVDRVSTRDGQLALPIGQNHVLALTEDGKTSLAEGADGIEMIDTRKL